MATIHILKGNPHVHSMVVPKRRHHHVWVKVVDQDHPTRTRWIVQFAIQRAASFKGTRGFTDKAVRAGRWHDFYVSAQLLSRFAARDLAPLVEDGLVRVEIDGREMEARAA